jgi:hypothetical protein
MFQTYLFIGSTAEKRQQEAIKLRDERGGKAVDTIEIPREDDTSIKIDHAREIQLALSRPPLAARVKTIILHEMERASIETQQALLKILEEPPAFALIILTAAKKESLLPTILSRTVVKKLKQTNEAFNLEEQYKLLHTTLNSDAQLKFSHGSRFDTKEEAVLWLQTALRSLHKKLLHDSSKHISINYSYIQCIRKTNRALHTLQTTNTSPRLLMENLLLDLPGVPSLDPSHK